MSVALDPSQLESWLSFALDCCDEADAMALRSFRRDMVIETKPDRTFVTEVDRAIEERIRERIAATFPGHGVVGEEFGTDAGDGSDPLVHRPDRRHAQLHARRSAVWHAPRARGGR